MLTYVDFSWTGQIAQFRVEGDFSYNPNLIGIDGIANTDELSSLNVSFISPDGEILRSYTDNHLDEGVNFNFDTNEGEILQDGVFDQSDGINIGDGTRSDGLTFWSKPFEQAVPHVHVDDWQDEFGFPTGFGSHEDVAFFDFTTERLVGTSAVGESYRDEIAEDPERLDDTGLRLDVVEFDESDSTFTPDFSTFDGDEIEVEGSGKLVFAGGGDDFVDTSIASEGGNRIYLGRGDDIATLGQGDRFYGGNGDDSFFALENGGNTISGGAGEDQFWITTGDFLGNTYEITASDGYYTFSGDVSDNSDVRLLSDKASIIGFPGFDTNSFLHFDAIPVDELDAGLISATLQLEHDEALADLASLIPATDERPVNVSAYALNDGAEFDPVNGNDGDIDFGLDVDPGNGTGAGPDFAGDAPNALSTTSVGADGVYEWDVTSLFGDDLEEENVAIALSGVFGNSDTDGFNSYAAFYPVGTNNGVEPTLVIETQGLNTITDFTSGEDVIGIAGFDVDFDDIELTDDNGSTLIGIFGTDFAVLEGVGSGELGESDFFIA